MRAVPEGMWRWSGTLKDLVVSVVIGLTGCVVIGLTGCVDRVRLRLCVLFFVFT